MSDFPITPVVTAVIPTRFRPELVLRAVQSVLDQTFHDLEVLVVVDGPDPATVTALTAIADPRVRFIVNPENVGPAEARNVGARGARAPWVAFLDDDDMWLPRKVEAQLALARTSTSEKTFVASYFLYRQPGKADVILPERFPAEGTSLAGGLFKPRQGGPHMSTFFCSKSLMLSTPFRSDSKIEDLDWLLRVSVLPDLRFMVVNEPLSVYEYTGRDDSFFRKVTWKDLLGWGYRNRALMARREYSGFVLFRCVPVAKARGQQWSALPTLLRHFLFVGSPSFSLFVHFVAMYLFPPNIRQAARKKLSFVFPDLQKAAR